MGFRATNVYFIAAFATLGGMLFGFDISSISGVIGTQQYIDYFNNPGSTQQGGITAAMPGGSFCGALVSGFLSDKFSRKYTIQLGAIIWCIGAILQCASINVGMLVVGRFIAGIAVGLTSSVVPVYQSEIAPKNVRGRIVSLQQWAITWGIMIQYFIQYGCSHINGTSSFRLPWGIQMVPAVILFVGLLFFPKSPRWLATKDRWDEARQVLADLRSGGDMSHPLVLAEFLEIEEQVRFERETSNNVWAEMRKPNMIKRIFLGCSVQAWSQLSGMNVMMYYIVYVMQGAGVSSVLLISSIQYIINVVMTLPAILFLDHWGRRPTFIIGALLMCFWLFLVGGLMGRFGSDSTIGATTTWVITNNPTASHAVTACSYLFVASFATTWGPASWAYPAEIFPANVRAISVGLATSSNWICNFALAWAVPPMLNHIKYKTYFVFGCFNAGAAIHMFLSAHETKRRTLEEMDEVFDSGVPAWKSSKIRSRRLEQLAEELARDKGAEAESEHVPVVNRAPAAVEPEKLV